MERIVRVGQDIMLVGADGHVRVALVQRVCPVSNDDLRTTYSILDCVNVVPTDAQSGTVNTAEGIYHRDDLAEPRGAIHWRLRTEHAGSYEFETADEVYF